VPALLDTHTFLWIAAEPEKLSPRAHTVCSSDSLILSAASIWEISIKSRTGRIALPPPHKDPFDRMLAAQCLEEKLPCVTRDRFFSACGVETIW
jgi:PIN domain nuclease of toxin-antitoxin system